MKISNIKNMKGGWFIGNFEPSVLNTDKFEVGYHRHKKGDPTNDHYHKESNEINLIIKGKMVVNGRELSTGDIFIFEPYVVSEAEFIEDTDLIVVRDSSNPTDKYGVSK
jgi:quercetin dioxygenase-like cupin family protein